MSELEFMGREDYRPDPVTGLEYDVSLDEDYPTEKVILSDE